MCCCVLGDVGLQRVQEAAGDSDPVGRILPQRVASTRADAGGVGGRGVPEQWSHRAVSVI